MINFNRKRFGKLDKSNSENTLYPGLSLSSRRLLGLREYKRLSQIEEEKLFITASRFQAYNAIKTNTGFRKHHIENKKGLVREIVKKGAINEKILQNNATIYLGSGVDIEYPLALGARDIYLVDPIYKDQKVISDLQSKVKFLIESEILTKSENRFVFSFDFGSGDEEVSVNIVPCFYGNENINFPNNIGLVITYASQGPNGKVEIGEDIESKLVDGGYLLGENTLQKKVSNKKAFIKLG